MAEINKEFEEIRYTQEELDKINAYYTTYAINYKGSYSHAGDVS